MYDQKIALVLLADLADWQKLNVAAFLAGAVAIEFPETHGASFTNASGATYLPFIKHPIFIYRADDEAQLRRAFQRAKERELRIGIYTRPLFGTKNEEGNHAEIGKFTDEEQELVGIVLYGDRRKVDKSVDGLKFHP